MAQLRATLAFAAKLAERGIVQGNAPVLLPSSTLFFSYLNQLSYL